MRAPTSGPAHRWHPGQFRQLARNPYIYWTIAVAAALCCGLLVAAAVPDPPPEPHIVWITSSAIEAGASLADSTRQVEAPGALVPSDALPAPPVDARAARALGANEILTMADVAGGASLTAGEAAVALPIGPATPPTSTGLPVLVVLHPDPFTPGSPARSSVVDGRVLSADDSQVLVAIDAAHVVVVSAALQFGTAALALTG